MRQYPSYLQGEPSHRRSTVLIGSSDGTRWTEITTLNTAGPFDVEMRNPSPNGRNAVRSIDFENLFRVSDKLVTRHNGDGFLVIRQFPSRTGGASTIRVESYNMKGQLNDSGRVLTIPVLPGSEHIAAGMWANLEREFSDGPLRMSSGDVHAELVRQLGAKPDLPVTTDELLTADGTLFMASSYRAGRRAAYLAPN